MPKIESLDLNNSIEIQKIREILKNMPDLLIMLDMIIKICNGKLNEQENKIKMKI